MPMMRRPAARRAMRRRRRVRRRRVLLVGGLIGVGIYKLTKKDADRIEQHTGVPVEELDDVELEHAMDNLGIEKQTVSSVDTEAVPTSPSTSSSNLDELQKLAELHDAGVLTDEEFAKMKAKLLNM